jgi:hypothetical protein
MSMNLPRSGGMLINFHSRSQALIFQFEARAVVFRHKNVSAFQVPNDFLHLWLKTRLPKIFQSPKTAYKRWYDAPAHTYLFVGRKPGRTAYQGWHENIGDIYQDILDILDILILICLIQTVLMSQEKISKISLIFSWKYQILDINSTYEYLITCLSRRHKFLKI